MCTGLPSHVYVFNPPFNVFDRRNLLEFQTILSSYVYCIPLISKSKQLFSTLLCRVLTIFIIDDNPHKKNSLHIAGCCISPYRDHTDISDSDRHKKMHRIHYPSDQWCENCPDYAEKDEEYQYEITVLIILLVPAVLFQVEQISHDTESIKRRDRQQIEYHQHNINVYGKVQDTEQR